MAITSLDQAPGNGQSPPTRSVRVRRRREAGSSSFISRYGLSIVIPTLNEEGNIVALCSRIRKALITHHIPYELIFVDDHSSDNTRLEIESLSAKRYPYRLFLKRGPKGKAQSLLEGFAHAKYSVLALIDADLQYPPEALPEMVRSVRTGGADIVVARRTDRRVRVARRICSSAFSFMFARVLHGIECDAQSGLKVFRREVLGAVSLGKPSPWAFDLDFLVRARDGGFRVAEHPVLFEERRAGSSKVRLVSASCQIGWSAIKLKFRRPGKGLYSPPSSTVDAEESAVRRLVPCQAAILAALFLLVATACAFNWHATTLFTVSVITLLYFVDLSFSIFLIYQAFTQSRPFRVDHLPGNTERDWPVYTILCPLYREQAVLPQFVTAITRLDYPKDRLEVLLLLEENDAETLDAAQAMELPGFFKIVVVPHSLPKTKPKACNYGLNLACGEYVVIYDAEDVPDPKQLKTAVLAFERSSSLVICLQAKLNFYNRSQNLLTRLFTAEYSLWFDLILPGLQACDCPIPLGGTSNHFKTAVLKTLGGWDAFNVTEDCDLGVRLAKRGLRTAILESTTLEEANSSLKNWFPQRTRWIKGYIQTYFVHMRVPQDFGPRSWLSARLWGFQLVVGGKVLSMLINPLMWALTFAYFALRPIASEAIESLFPGPVLYIGVASLVFGNFLYLYSYMVGCTRRGHDDIVKFTFVVPLYWIAISVAAWMAVYQFVRQPHYWAKTNHGLHLSSREGLAEAEHTVGGLVDAALLGHRRRLAG